MMRIGSRENSRKVYCYNDCKRLQNGVSVKLRAFLLIYGAFVKIYRFGCSISLPRFEHFSFFFAFLLWASHAQILLLILAASFQKPFLPIFDDFQCDFFVSTFPSFGLVSLQRLFQFFVFELNFLSFNVVFNELLCATTRFSL